MGMRKGRRSQKDNAKQNVRPDEAAYWADDDEVETEELDETLYSDDDWSPRTTRRQRRRHDAMRRLEDARERRRLSLDLEDWNEYGDWDNQTDHLRHHH